MAESDYNKVPMVEATVHTIPRLQMKKEDDLPHPNTDKYRSQESGTVPGAWSNNSSPYNIAQPVVKAADSDGLEILDIGRKVKTPGGVKTSLKLHAQVVIDRMIITTGDGFNTHSVGMVNTNDEDKNKETDYLNVYDTL